MAKKILVIDDEEDVRVYLSSLLEDNGYEVLVAEDVDKAKELMEKEKPDLMTLDLMMPGESGVKYYRELRKSEQYKDFPVIMITGVTPENFPMMDFKKFIYSRKTVKGPEDFIEKPIDKEKLLAAIKKLLS